MMNMMKIILIFFYVAVFTLSNLAASENESDEISTSMKLHYIVFKSSPYGQVSYEDVTRSPHYVFWFYGEHRFIGHMRKVLEKREKSEKINTDQIRLKVEILGNSKATYFVDRNGVVENKESGQTYKLNDDELFQLHQEILEYKGVVDQRPTIDPWR